MSGWPLRKLRDLGMWTGGGTPSKSRAEFWDAGSIPWLSPKDMGATTITGTRDRITTAAVEGSAVRLIDAGSVAVVARSGILDRTIPVALVPFATTLNQDMKALTPAPDVDARWVAWGLRAHEQDLLRTTRKAGTTVASLEWPRFLNHELPVPPLDEQRRIVDILEDHLSRLDASEASTARALRLAQSLRSALYNATFRALVTEHGTQALASQVAIENGQTPRGLVERLTDAPGPGAVPFFKVGDMNDADGRRMSRARFYISHTDAAELGLHVRRPGVVLIPKRGGAIATNKKRILGDQAAYDLNTMGLRPSDHLSTEYLWHWLGSVDLARIADGSNVPQINAPQINKLRLPIPPLAEQDRIAALLDERLAGLDHLTATCESVRFQSRALRRALLAAAFSGRLTRHSSDLDLAEEMAAT